MIGLPRQRLVHLPPGVERRRPDGALSGAGPVDVTLTVLPGLLLVASVLVGEA